MQPQDLRGNGDGGLRLQLFRRGKSVSREADAEGLQNALRKFIRARRREDDHGRAAVCLAEIAVPHRDRHRGVRIQRIIVFLKKRRDGLIHQRFPREPRVKGICQRRSLPRGDRIALPLGKLPHAGGGERRVPPGKFKNQPLQVGRDEDIHGRAGRLEKGTVQIVGARSEKVRQNIVLVGRADEFSHREPHLFGVPPRENVAEIPRGDDEVHRFARRDLARPHEVAVCGKVIDDLRAEPAEVDGIGGRENHALFFQRARHVPIGKDLFDGGLAVVEIPLDGEHADVVPLLNGHLALLHFADALVRIKDHDFDAFRVLEALERRLAGIAARRHEDQNGIPDPAEVAPLAQQKGQERERHVLKGKRGPVEQLHDVVALVQLHDGSGLPLVKLTVCLPPSYTSKKAESTRAARCG